MLLLLLFSVVKRFQIPKALYKFPIIFKTKEVLGRNLEAVSFLLKLYVDFF